MRDLVERDIAAASAAERARSPAPSHRMRGTSSSRRSASDRRVHERGADRYRTAATDVVAAWSAWRRDAKYGARLLAKQRDVLAVVVLTLALAIGANTVIFTFADVLMLRPLPLRDPATLGWVFNIGPQGDNRALSSSPTSTTSSASSRSFARMAA